MRKYFLNVFYTAHQVTNMGNWLIILSAVIVLLISSCQKNGTLGTAPAVTDVSLRFRSLLPDQKKYIAFIDGQQIGDTLANGRPIFSAIIIKKQEKQQLVIREVQSGELLIDTSLVLPAPVFSLLLFQLENGRQPLFFPGIDDEPAPGEDSVKLRFVYSDTNLPDSIRMRYYHIDQYNLSYAIFDSVTLYRNIVGPYTTATLKYYYDNVADGLFGFDIVDPFSGQVLQAFDLDPNSPRFAEGVMDEAPLATSQLINKKQTLLLGFGWNSYLPDTYNETFLMGSD